MKQGLLCVFLSLVLTGCQSVAISHSKEKKIGDFALISSPLDYQHHVINTSKTAHQICQSPPSNALVGSSDSLGLSGAGDSVSASDGVSDKMSARGDPSYIASDMMYRLCEFIQNSALSQEEATALFKDIMQSVGAIGVAVASANKSNASSDDDSNDNSNDDSNDDSN